MKTWPFIEDLLEYHKLPADLAARLAERYEAHAGEYATKELYEDGIDAWPINACMFKDNLQDVEEELTDSIFNTLVYEYRNKRVSDSLLKSLLQAWANLNTEKNLRGLRESS